MEYGSVVGVITMGTIAPRAGIEPKYLAFRVSVLTITPTRVPDVTISPTPARLCNSLSVFQLYHGVIHSSHLILQYEMRRRKPKLTLFSTLGIFNLPHPV